MESLRIAVQASLGERMVSMNSTLVETVSINYEDFNESFLTCGTCLCMYDGSEHTPKLLQCSHTVCLHCLTRIAASQTRDTGSFRCPICRELITIPRGGVAALPPSFLVNQLLDLMSRQRREVIPKCSVHINQELLFCETCDTVFCTLCTDGSGTHHQSTSQSCEHTIIPFSIAIKRMSEIVLYKANECIAKLTQAQEGVDSELRRLDAAKEMCLDQINVTFQRIQTLLDGRKQEIIDALNTTCTEKRKVLEEQHGLIETEKNKVEQECQGLQYQVEVRNITQRVESLSAKLDAAIILGEPRENAFLTCDFQQNTNSLELIEEHLQLLGRVRTSTTFPNLCTARLDEDGSVVANIETGITVTTVDYHGNCRKTGGDPISAELIPVLGETTSRQLDVEDCGDGTYRIPLCIRKAGRYGCRLTIFQRAIKDNPIYFDVTDHNDPVMVYGQRGSGKDEFLQPVAVAIDPLTRSLYVLDTGNSRVKVLNGDSFEFERHLTNEGLLGRSCTGIAVSTRGVVVVNWRTRFITEIHSDSGETVRTFTYGGFQEPIDVAIDRNYGHILVADNGQNCVFVFDEDGKILFQVGKRGTFNLITALTIGPAGEIVVADSRIQMFSAKGDFLEVIYDEGKGKGRYGGIAVDMSNRVLVSRTEQKGRSYVHVLPLHDTNSGYVIDSRDSKLKRPNGIALIDGGRYVVVVDLGNNCIKKYKYC